MAQNGGIIGDMSYRPKFRINQTIRQLLAESEQIRARVGDGGVPVDFASSIRYRASVETIHSSTSIEGNPLTRQQVQAALHTKQKLSKLDYATLEVRNYKHALDYIAHRRHGEIELTTDDVLDLHRIITTDLLNETRCGRWRPGHVHIQGERGQVVYTAPAPRLVRRLMTDLIDWANEQIYVLHPVIVAGVLHERLAAIHPFADGNGRTARALALLYLTLHHYDCGACLSLDQYYASDRRAYYEILRQTNGKNFLQAGKADLTAWLEYFVAGYVSALKILEAEIKILALAFPVTPAASLQRIDEDLLRFAAKFGAITIAQAEMILPEVTRRTLQRHLQELVAQGRLRLDGESRRSRYVLAGVK